MSVSLIKLQKLLRDIYQDPDLRVLNPYVVVQDGNIGVSKLTTCHGHTESTAIHKVFPLEEIQKVTK